MFSEPGSGVFNMFFCCIIKTNCVTWVSSMSPSCRPQVTASCPAVCECHADPLPCSPGVSAVTDACGCCKVCAAQLNQDCSQTRPCDHHKGLECNYGNDVTMAWGICRGEEGENLT